MHLYGGGKRRVVAGERLGLARGVRTSRQGAGACAAASFSRSSPNFCRYSLSHEGAFVVRDAQVTMANIPQRAGGERRHTAPLFWAWRARTAAAEWYFANAFPSAESVPRCALPLLHGPNLRESEHRRSHFARRMCRDRSSERAAGNGDGG